MSSSEDLELISGMIDKVNSFDRELANTTGSPIKENSVPESFGLDKRKILEQSMGNAANQPPVAALPNQQPIQQIPAGQKQEIHKITPNNNTVTIPPNLLSTILRKLVSIEKTLSKIVEDRDLKNVIKNE